MVDERGFSLFYVHSAGLRRSNSYISQFRKLNYDDLKSLRTMIRLKWGYSMTTWYSQKTWIFRSTPKMCWLVGCLLRWPRLVTLSLFNNDFSIGKSLGYISHGGIHSYLRGYVDQFASLYRGWCIHEEVVDNDQLPTDNSSLSHAQDCDAC